MSGLTGARGFALLSALFVDALGSGSLAPFELIYGYRVVGVSLMQTGVALSLGSLASIPLGPLAGAMADRVGARRVAALSNLAGALGCVLLLWADGLASLAAASFLLAASQRLLWAVFTPLVAASVGPTDLEVWFGRLRAARFIGISTGQALAGAFLLMGITSGLQAIVVWDGLTFLVAMSVLAAGSSRSKGVGEMHHGGYRAALGDRANGALAGINVLATLLILAPSLALPVLVLEQLGLPTWLPGMLAAIGTVVVGLGTMFSPTLLRGRRRLRNLQLAALLWAAGLAAIALAPRAGVAVVAVLIISIVVWALGEALYAPTSDALPAALAPPGLLGRYAAMHQLAWGVSEVIAPSLVGVLLTMGAHTVWLTLTAVAVLTAILYRATERIVRDRDGIAGLTEIHQSSTDISATKTTAPPVSPHDPVV